MLVTELFQLPANGGESKNGLCPLLIMKNCRSKICRYVMDDSNRKQKKATTSGGANLGRKQQGETTLCWLCEEV